jgi:RNA polymerase-binding transcription factor DksA
MATAFIEVSVGAALVDTATVSRLRDALLAERAAQLEVAAESDATAEELSGHDGANTIVGRELAGASAARARMVIAEVDSALARMGDGTYGLCEHCREPIPFERLDAVPHARFCVRCAEAARGIFG